MANLTKKDIKELLDKKIDPFARSVSQEFGKVHKELGSTRTDLDEVKSGVAWMKKNSSELFEKLDKFISLYEHQKIELASLSAQVSRLQEEVDRLKAIVE